MNCRKCLRHHPHLVIDAAADRHAGIQCQGLAGIESGLLRFSPIRLTDQRQIASDAAENIRTCKSFNARSARYLKGRLLFNAFRPLAPGSPGGVSMPNLYVATNGLSIWRSTDLGETLERMPTGTGLYSGTRAWSLLSTSRGLLAGTDSGIYRWDAAPNVWVPLPSPLNCQLITALAASPGNPNVILAGAQQGSLYRSENGGESWRKIEAAIAPYVNVGFWETPEFVAKSDVRPPARHWTRVDPDSVRPPRCERRLGRCQN